MPGGNGSAVAAAFAAALLLGGGGAPAQTERDRNVATYEKAKKDELIAAGQRHVDLGWGIRDTGLRQQSTYQLVRAVEISEGTHQGAAMVLGIVRAYPDAIWRHARKRPTRQSLRSYEKKAALLEVADQKGQVKLAKSAEKARLQDVANAHWLAALRLGAELVVTDKGATVGGEKVDPETLAWLQQQTIAVNGKQLVFEPAGGKAPKLEGVHEHKNERIVVRTDLPVDTARELAALGAALWEPLVDRLDGSPVRTLQLFVFRKRADYAAYLQSLGHQDAGTRGLCDYGTYQTLVCAEGLEPADLQAIVLHELTHLFAFGSSPIAMPDWHAEGLAETFGGQGTFLWDGKALKTGGPMRADRVAAVKGAPMPLKELFAADAAQLLANDHERGLVFYAESQLLQRFFGEDGCPWGERFEWWENECRGKLPGAASTARLGDPAPARAAFDKLFGQDLDALEKAFLGWLEKQ